MFLLQVGGFRSVVCICVYLMDEVSEILESNSSFLQFVIVCLPFGPPAHSGAAFIGSTRRAFSAAGQRKAVFIHPFKRKHTHSLTHTRSSPSLSVPHTDSSVPFKFRTLSQACSLLAQSGLLMLLLACEGCEFGFVHCVNSCCICVTQDLLNLSWKLECVCSSSINFCWLTTSPNQHTGSKQGHGYIYASRQSKVGKMSALRQKAELLLCTRMKKHLNNLDIMASQRVLNNNSDSV